jgi:hypothetical protein
MRGARVRSVDSAQDYAGIEHLSALACHNVGPPGEAQQPLPQRMQPVQAPPRTSRHTMAHTHMCSAAQGHGGCTPAAPQAAAGSWQAARRPRLARVPGRGGRRPACQAPRASTLHTWRRPGRSPRLARASQAARAPVLPAPAPPGMGRCPGARGLAGQGEAGDALTPPRPPLQQSWWCGGSCKGVDRGEGRGGSVASAAQGRQRAAVVCGVWAAVARKQGTQRAHRAVGDFMTAVVQRRRPPLAPLAALLAAAPAPVPAPAPAPVPLPLLLLLVPLAARPAAWRWCWWRQGAHQPSARRPGAAAQWARAASRPGSAAPLPDQPAAAQAPTPSRRTCAHRLMRSPSWRACASSPSPCPCPSPCPSPCLCPSWRAPPHQRPSRPAGAGRAGGLGGARGCVEHAGAR